MGGDQKDRVLVVEDNPDFAALTKLSLEKRGEYEIDVESSAHEALSGIPDRDYECIISDYDMSGMNGLELLEALREAGQNIPFILFTGKGSEEVASEAISLHVTDYLQKGGSADKFELLANRVNNAITGYRAETDLRREKRLSERIVQSLPIGLVVHDRNGDVILTNDRANEILGTTQAELNADEYESGSWKLRDADGEPVSYDRLPFTRVAAGEDLRDEPYTVLTRDGDVKQTVVSGARIRDEDDVLTAVIIPFRVVGEE